MTVDSDAHAKLWPLMLCATGKGDVTSLPHAQYRNGGLLLGSTICIMLHSAEYHNTKYSVSDFGFTFY